MSRNEKIGMLLLTLAVTLLAGVVVALAIQVNDLQQTSIRMIEVPNG